ncbi:glycosyltransferase family 4 protein [Aestuariivirga sp.]|uniref:glycosyltransferase family 4 protein n=1 Tax=Aestuariivirga sp. TaxID=2650926 RepID=UPI0039E70434
MRILHVFRTPVGGLFRHVRDLTRGQCAEGHEVGVICDSTTGGITATALLDSIAPHCSLGIIRIPISRLPGLGDLSGAKAVMAQAKVLKPDIIHCHGAKGGLYGRIAAWRLGIPSVYTAHGGSLHYSWASPSGVAFLSAEKALTLIGTALHFVCQYEKDTFVAKIGIGKKLNAVIHNGLWPEEFADFPLADDASDLLFIGDMRMIKGVDTLIEAVSICNRARPTTALMVGDGPDLEKFKTQSKALELNDKVVFAGRMPAAEAFSRGNLVVMPSRAESFPYVVLEACAAGKPLVASGVGGIPEILGSDMLVPPDNPQALADRLLSLLNNPAAAQTAAAIQRLRVKQHFSAGDMVNGVLALYRAAIS